MSVHAEERHHASVKQVSHLSFHLHIDVLYQHAIYYGDGLEVDGELCQLLLVVPDVINLFREGDIVVTLVTGTLPLEAPNALFNIHFDPSQLRNRFLDRALYFSRDSVVELLVLVD